MTYSVQIVSSGAAETVSATGFCTSIPLLYVRFDPKQVVFRYGRPDKPYAKCPAYSVDILKDGVVIGHRDLPEKPFSPTWNFAAHYFYAQWIFPVVPNTYRTPAEITALGVTPFYGLFGGKQPPKPGNVYDPSWPMDNAGITYYQPMTGERNDIAYLHEAFAYGMQTGDWGPALAISLGGMSRPLFIMDPATGKMIDMIARPWASLTNASGTPDLMTGYADPSWSQNPDTPWTEDPQHQPETFFCGYLITGNEIYAEACQAQATRHLQGSKFFMNTSRDQNWQPPLTYAIQQFGGIRDMAWPMRSIIVATKATQMVEQDCTARGVPFPSYMLTFAQMKALLDNQFKFLTDYFMNSGVLDAFRIPCSPVFPGIGFLDYLNQTVLMAVKCFPNEQKYKDFVLWTSPNFIMRCSGKSGMPLACSSYYRLQLTKTGPGGLPWTEQNSPNPILAVNGLKASDFFTPAEAWQNIVTQSAGMPPNGNVYNLLKSDIDKLVADPTNGMFPAVWDFYTLMELNAVMTLAVDLQRGGVINFGPDLEPSFANVNTLLNNWVNAAPNNVVAARVSFVLDGNPPPIIIPPPIDPPDQGASMNPSSLSLKPGESRHVTLIHDAPFDVAPTYSSSNNEVASQVPDADPAMGCTVTAGNKGGAAVITMHAHGQGDIIATCNVTVSVPLASQAGTYLQPDTAPTS